MKNPDQIRDSLEEKMIRVINEETEELLEYNIIVQMQMSNFLDLIMNELFGVKEEELEELHMDMDKFSDEE